MALTSSAKCKQDWRNEYLERFDGFGEIGSFQGPFQSKDLLVRDKNQIIESREHRGLHAMEFRGQ